MNIRLPNGLYVDIFLGFDTPLGAGLWWGQAWFSTQHCWLVDYFHTFICSTLQPSHTRYVIVKLTRPNLRVHVLPLSWSFINNLHSDQGNPLSTCSDYQCVERDCGGGGGILCLQIRFVSLWGRGGPGGEEERGGDQATNWTQWIRYYY